MRKRDSAFKVVSGSATLGAQTVITGPAGDAQTTATPTALGAIVVPAGVAGLGAVAIFDETGIAPSSLSQLSVLPAALAFTAPQGGGNPPAARVAISKQRRGRAALDSYDQPRSRPGSRSPILRGPGLPQSPPSLILRACSQAATKEPSQ